MVERLFLAVPRGCLQFVIVVFPDHTHLLFLLLSSHIAILSICNCQLTPYTRDVRNELLIVLYLDIHVGHDKNQYIPI